MIEDVWGSLIFGTIKCNKDFLNHSDKKTMSTILKIMALNLMVFVVDLFNLFASKGKKKGKMYITHMMGGLFVPQRSGGQGAVLRIR